MNYFQKLVTIKHSKFIPSELFVLVSRSLIKESVFPPFNYVVQIIRRSYTVFLYTPIYDLSVFDAYFDPPPTCGFTINRFTFIFCHSSSRVLLSVQSTLLSTLVPSLPVVPVRTSLVVQSSGFPFFVLYL